MKFSWSFSAVQEPAINAKNPLGTSSSIFFPTTQTFRTRYGIIILSRPPALSLHEIEIVMIFRKTVYYFPPWYEIPSARIVRTDMYSTYASFSFSFPNHHRLVFFETQPFIGTKRQWVCAVLLGSVAFLLDSHIPLSCVLIWKAQ